MGRGMSDYNASCQLTLLRLTASARLDSPRKAMRVPQHTPKLMLSNALHEARGLNLREIVEGNTLDAVTYLCSQDTFGSVCGFTSDTPSDTMCAAVHTTLRPVRSCVHPTVQHRPLSCHRRHRSFQTNSASASPVTSASAEDECPWS